MTDPLSAEQRAEAVRKHVRPSDVLIVGARITDELVRILREVIEPSWQTAIRAHAQAEQREYTASLIEGMMPPGVVGPMMGMHTMAIIARSTPVDAIKARAAAATPGPWWAASKNRKDGIGIVGCGVGEAAAPIAVLAGARQTIKDRQANAEFIAAARTDVEALVAEVERLREVVARVEALCEVSDIGGWGRPAIAVACVRAALRDKP